jgi:extracellular elastinolytic metalloproteinase
MASIMRSFIFSLVTICLALSRKEYKREIADSLPLFWAPDASFTTMKVDSFADTREFAGQELREKALRWAKQNFALAEGDEIVIKNESLDEKTKLYHASMVKRSQGLEIVNSIAQITYNVKGQLISHGESWVDTSNSVNLVKRGEGISCEQGLEKIANSLKVPANMDSWVKTPSDNLIKISNVSFTIDDVQCTEKMYQTKSGLTHVLDITVPTLEQYLNVMVDKASGKILGAADWGSNFSITNSGRLEKRQAGTNFKYRALQLGALDPRTVKPSLIENPADLNASPQGWHNGNSETSGNNVLATENREAATNIRAVANNGKLAKSDNFDFDFEFDDTKDDPSQYTTASIVNVFFVSNRFHDIMYGYGFDEASGNFQLDNFQKGGRGGDPVIAITQDGSGKNNANFATPPDGTPGIMRMFVFDRTTPERDGSFENAIVIHELTHGLSTRLTGGPSNSNCLSQVVGGGMGEGWSDILGIALEMESIDTRNDPKPVGAYAAANPTSGVRRFPYSTSLDANPTVYSFGRQTRQVHQIGEIWSSMLFEVYWNLVDKFGFDKDFRRNPNGTNGNNRFLKVLVEGMKLQPCFPNFVTARDAILLAEQQLFNGEGKCEIIKGFAKRGLGINAKADFADDFTIPRECQ